MDFCRELVRYYDISSLESFFLLVYPVCLLPLVLLYVHEGSHRRAIAVQPKGCRRLGVRDKSNISDEFNDHRYATGSAAGEDDSGQPRWKVKALFIHPIKSCAPVEVDVADIDGGGMMWDRQFAFAEFLEPQTRLDAPESEKQPRWTFRTQRQSPYEKLSLVQPEVWVPDAQAVKNMTQKGADKEGVLVVKYPNLPVGRVKSLLKVGILLGVVPAHKSFRMPLIPPPNHTYPAEDVVIWKDTPRWLNYGEHVPQDFKAYLGVNNDFTIFRVDPSWKREVWRCAPRKDSLGYQSHVGFADAYPLHLLNLASVRNVAEKVRKEIPQLTARRFRSNILITGPPAFDEDDWKRVRIGRQDFYCACHTVRCKLPNVDPDSGARHAREPDKTLKSLRCIDAGDPNNACLGLQLVPALEQGTRIQGGDEVEVVDRGQHRYIPQHNCTGSDCPVCQGSKMR